MIFNVSLGKSVANILELQICSRTDKSLTKGFNEMLDMVLNLLNR
jgi:hypothetical protein